MSYEQLLIMDIIKSRFKSSFSNIPNCPELLILTGVNKFHNLSIVHVLPRLLHEPVHVLFDPDAYASQCQTE